MEGAYFCERALSPAVRDGGPGFEAIYPHHVERELDEQAGGLRENAGSPEGVSEHKPPLGHVRSAGHPAQLEDPDRLRQAVGHYAKADVPAFGPGLNRPLDESFVAFRRGGRRRDELRHLLIGQEREKRRRVAEAQLAQHDTGALQGWRNVVHGHPRSRGGRGRQITTKAVPESSTAPAAGVRSSKLRATDELSAPSGRVRASLHRINALHEGRGRPFGNRETPPRSASERFRDVDDLADM